MSEPSAHGEAPGPTIRPAVAADVAGILRCVREAYALYVPRIGREPAPMTADYAELVARGEVWVALDAGNLAGIVVLRSLPESLFLENVAVSPALQGRGIGRALIAFAEHRARALGLPEVTLYTNERMTENLAMYPTLGYLETGRRVEEGFARVYFAKPLG